MVPGAADDSGTLWLMTHSSVGQSALTRIDPQLPLGPGEWVDWWSPAASGRNVHLFASLAPFGKSPTFEGAFLIPVGPNGLGEPRRIAVRRPQFPTLLGDGAGQFLVAGDQ